MNDQLSPTFWNEDQPLLKTFTDKNGVTLSIVVHALWIGGYKLWVYKSRPERVGVCNCDFIDYMEFAGIDSIRVNEEHRGSGLGRELLRLAVEETKHRGYRSLYLIVSSYYLEATPFLFDWYGRNGFIKSDDLSVEDNQTLLKKEV